MRVSICLTATVCLLLVPGAPAAPASAQDSPALVKQLVAAMTARKLDAIAAADPAEPGRFVAALVFPGVQMLLVSARHESVDYLALQITKRQYHDVYGALQAGAGKLFVHDMGCDGLIPSAENADTVYDGSDQMLFDGAWVVQSLVDSSFVARHKSADERYSRALRVLLEAVKGTAAP